MNITTFDLVTIGYVFLKGTRARPVVSMGEIGSKSFVAVVEIGLESDVIVA